jgi:hypothetical protein
MYADWQAHDAVAEAVDEGERWWSAVSDALTRYGSRMSVEGAERVSCGTRTVTDDGRVILTALGKAMLVMQAVTWERIDELHESGLIAA